MSRIARRDVLRGGGAALGALAFGGCGCPATFVNQSGTMSVTPQKYESPESAVDLVNAVGDAEEQGLRVRMTGSGHSHSDVAVTSDVLLRPDRLNRVLTLDRARLRAAHRADPHYFRVESGIPLHALNKALDRAGLALENMGGYDAQTIVGAAITGTHGTGLGYGPIASQIVSLQVVGDGGRVRQLEPTNGLSDPASFPGRLEEDPEISVELVQNDELFHAATVSLGCLGVVYAVVLRTVPKYWLREVRSLTSWNRVKAKGGYLDRIVSGQKLRDAGPDPEFYDLLVAPYAHAGADGSPDYSVLLTERFRMTAPPKDLSADDRTRGGIADVFGGVQGVLIRLINGPAVDLVNAHPELVPGLHEQAIRGLVDASYVNLSYKVFNLGPLNLAKVVAIEMAFDLEQSVAATERLFALAREFQARRIVHTTPFSLRFIGPASAWIAPQYGRRTMMIETPMLVGARGAEELLKSYESRFIAEFDARPHWGLDLDILRSEAEVARLYPQSWPRWKAAYDALNTRGTFDGRFTDRLGISRRPRAQGGKS